MGLDAGQPRERLLIDVPVTGSADIDPGSRQRKEACTGDARRSFAGMTAESARQ